MYTSQSVRELLSPEDFFETGISTGRPDGQAAILFEGLHHCLQAEGVIQFGIFCHGHRAGPIVDVQENRIKEAAFRSFSKNLYDGLEPVIIDDDGKWRGYYLFSTAEEAVLKWERQSE